MTVKFRDYYEILGLQRGSSTDEIKSAYRRLARKYHPDLNRSDASAAEHFREVQEAYDVLSDPAKRRRYDSIGAGYQEGMDFQMPNGYDFHRAPKEAEVSSGLGGFSEFFEMLFGGGIRGGVRSSRNGERKRYPNPSSRRGNDVETILPVTLEEIFSGTRKKVRLNVNATCPACQGSGFIGESKCGACEGRGQAPRAKTLDIKIPITAREGARIRLAGQGEAGAGPDAQPGDLFAHVRIQPHPVFKAEGNNINIELPVAPWEAVLGGEVDVPTLDGPVKMKLPPGTQNAVKLRLQERGLKTEFGRGDEIVRVRIVIPTELTERERHLFRQLRDISHFRPRVRDRSTE